jgi:hypothetical protein
MDYILLKTDAEISKPTQVATTEMPLKEDIP